MEAAPRRIPEHRPRGAREPSRRVAATRPRGARREARRQLAYELASGLSGLALAHFGVPWTRVRPGRNTCVIRGEKVEIEEPAEKAGLLMHRDFGGTAKWRSCYASAGIGHAVLYVVDGEVVRLGIDVRDRV